MILSIGEPGCVMADNFTTLGSEDLDWSDTDHTTSNDITDDELWSDNNTDSHVNSVTTHSPNTALVTATSSLKDTITCTSTNDDSLLQSEALVSSNNILTNEMSEDTESANEITANNVLPSRPLQNNNEVVPIKAPSILTYSEALEEVDHDEESTNAHVMNDNSQTVVLLSRMSSSEDVNTYFDELVDLPSSPTENNSTTCSNLLSPLPCSNNILNPIGCSSDSIDDQCLMDQLSTISCAELDDECIAEDFDWN